MDRSRMLVSLFFLLWAYAASAPTEKIDLEVYSFHINSTVIGRYAITTITSRVANRLNQSQEAEFLVKIPKNAFISKFNMVIEGKKYEGVVKQKEQAQQQYTEAVARGESAGLVSSVGRTLEEFQTSVTLAALKKVTFELTYEELLKRRHGKYELLIHARPTQPVKDFKVDVHIHENHDISHLEVKGSLSTNQVGDTIKTSNQVWVQFYPTREQQTLCDGCGPQGLDGDLRIIYDVDRSKSEGDLITSANYFVHYFAPTDLQRISKNVVFVIDRSGSMHGRKIEQTRDALLKILEDLSEDDNFGLIAFDHSVEPWKRELLKATPDNLAAAKSFVSGIRDGGATNINSALLDGVQLLNQNTQSGFASILILLTDGDPTSGETNMERIQGNVRGAIGKKFPLYCLGFGYDVNFDFLKKMALENSGAARRIYEDSDAALQLQGFYEEVATPLLKDVLMNYTGSSNLTQTSFSQYYNGSEIVVAGQISNSVEFSALVIAISKENVIRYEDTTERRKPNDSLHDDFHIQRVWAYLTVKQLLEKEVQLSGEQKEQVKKGALELALRYSFVTPLTSMVVTKPDEENTQIAHKPKEGESHHDNPRQHDLGHGFRAKHTSGYPNKMASPSTSKPMRKFYGGIPRPSFIHPGLPGDSGHPRLSYIHPGLPGHSGYPRLSGRHGHPGFYGISQGYPAFDSVDEDVDDAHPIDQGRVLSLPVNHVQPTFLPVTRPPATQSPAVPTIRFLFPAEGQALPLCFDFSLGEVRRLRLLQDPNVELEMNGELGGSARPGFKKVVIHYKKDQDIELNTTQVTFRDGQKETHFLWNQEPTNLQTDSLTLIMRDQELNITVGTAQIIIQLSRQNDETFLWPVVGKRPSGDNIDGLMGKAPVTYEEVQGTQAPNRKISINNHEVVVSKGSAVDFSVHSAPRVDCLLLSHQSDLKKLLDFTITQL